MASDALQHALGLAKERLEDIGPGQYEEFNNTAAATCDLANALIRGAEVILKSEEAKAPSQDNFTPIE